MTFCSSCGTENNNISKFCAECGAEISRVGINSNTPPPHTSNINIKTDNIATKIAPKNLAEPGIFNFLFTKNLTHQVNNFILLVIFNVLLTIGIEYSGIYPKSEDSPDIIWLIIFGAILIAIIYFLVNKAKEKLSMLWLYPIFALYIYSFISAFDPETMGKLHALKELASRDGSLNVKKIIFYFFVIWDIYLGTIVEAILIFNISKNIKLNK